MGNSRIGKNGCQVQDSRLLETDFGLNDCAVVVDCSDLELACVLSNWFGFRDGGEAQSSLGPVIEVRRTGSVYMLRDGKAEVHAEGFSEALGLLDAAFERRLRSLASRSVFAIHSCAVRFGDGTAVIVGTSGAGKTTLGLALTQAGLSLIGDEFGYLDSETGNYWHAEYPIALKRDTAMTLAFSRILGHGIKMVSPYGVCSELLPVRRVRDAVESETVCSIGGLPLRALIFPSRTDGSPPSIRRPSVTELPRLLMPSIDGLGTRARVFSRALGVISRNGCELIEIEYGDAKHASQAILAHLMD